MLIRFISRGIESHNILNRFPIKEAYTKEGLACFSLFRQDGYFYNANIIEELKDSSRAVIYTDDEQMLLFAQYNKTIHNYNVEIMFDEEFVSLMDIYPNIRPENNLVKLYQTGVLQDAYYDYLQEKENFNEENK